MIYYPVIITTEKYIRGDNFDIETWCEKYFGEDGYSRRHQWQVQYDYNKDTYKFNKKAHAFWMWIVWND